MNDATTLLFGLPGLRVITVTQQPDGTRIVDAVTNDPAAATCPECGLVSTSRKENTVTRPKDIPYGVDRILLRWIKSRWRCRTANCERNTFTETIWQVPARARATSSPPPTATASTSPTTDRAPSARSTPAAAGQREESASRPRRRHQCHQRPPQRGIRLVDRAKRVGVQGFDQH